MLTAVHCLPMPVPLLRKEIGIRTFCRKTPCRKTFCRETVCRTVSLPTDILSNGQFDERTFCQKDILPKGQLAENVTHFSTIKYVLNWTILSLLWDKTKNRTTIRIRFPDIIFPNRYPVDYCTIRYHPVLGKTISAASLRSGRGKTRIIRLIPS